MFKNLRNKNTALVMKFEYFRTVSRPSFWATTLFMPIFIGVVTFVSGYSGAKGEELLEEKQNDVKTVCVNDESSILVQESLPDIYIFDTEENCKDKLFAEKVDLVISYPADLLESGKYSVFAIQGGDILQNLSLADLGNTLFRLNSYAAIEDPTILTPLLTTFQSELTEYDTDRNVVESGYEKFIVPGISMAIFFFAVFVSANFMLQSVSEEKENRMIEMILSVIEKETLIYGKILGLSLVVLTQLLLWIVLGYLVFNITQSSFAFDLPFTLKDIDFTTLPINLYFTMMGFLMFSAIMVGVGSVGTSYKDSQSLSSVFIILSIFPIYLLLLIISDPSGLISQIFTYFPFTAPMMFVVRNSLNSLSPLETAGGVVIVGLYVLIAFKIAIKLFDLGALMYASKPKIADIMGIFKK